MRWIREHLRLLGVLSVVLILLVAMIVSYLAFGSASPVGRLAGEGLTAVQAPLSGIGNRIAGGVSSIFSFYGTNQENEALKKQISELNRKIVGLQLERAELQELRDLKSALNYQGVIAEYDYITADVVAVDDTDIFSIFTINVGSAHGIVAGSAVMNGDGLVGRIYQTGSHWSKVISVIDENNSVSFRVIRDVPLLGILSGDGSGGLNGYMLDSGASVIEGDDLITSGLGSYPAGIVIGKVSEVQWQNDQLIKAVTIEPAVNFKDMQKVVVITEK